MCRGKSLVIAVALSCLVLLSLGGQCYGQLQQGFYRGKCISNNDLDFFGRTSFKEEDVEKIVEQEVSREFFNDPKLAAALLRLLFHDCFVEGCDASILLDGTGSEKEAGANQSVRGYDVIERIKKVLERICPGVVSCADIIALATRDAVALASREKLRSPVKTGRKDGFVSLASNVDLPSSTISVSQSIDKFKLKGLSETEMVLLLGAHTVGMTHCGFFQDRLYRADEPMDADLRRALQARCPQDGSGSNNPVALDQGTPMAVDKSYFDQISTKRGILQIDQDLFTSGLTNKTVIEIAAKGFDFAVRFGQAMAKLGEVGVKTTEDQGEIRTTCGRVNFS
ncbi:peroxidase 60 [Morus notabilis]|nr:peroxidase 60 [Morus notabilis]